MKGSTYATANVTHTDGPPKKSITVNALNVLRALIYERAPHFT